MLNRINNMVLITNGQLNIFSSEVYLYLLKFIPFILANRRISRNRAIIEKTTCRKLPIKLGLVPYPVSGLGIKIF